MQKKFDIGSSSVIQKPIILRNIFLFNYFLSQFTLEIYNTFFFICIFFYYFSIILILFYTFFFFNFRLSSKLFLQIQIFLFLFSRIFSFKFYFSQANSRRSKLRISINFYHTTFSHVFLASPPVRNSRKKSISLKCGANFTNFFFFFKISQRGAARQRHNSHIVNAIAINAHKHHRHCAAATAATQFIFS